MSGNVVQLRPGDDGRWVAAFGPLGWVVSDTWSPGDFCAGFKDKDEAVAEARRRNEPREPSAALDDEAPF